MEKKDMPFAIASVFFGASMVWTIVELLVGYRLFHLYNVIVALSYCALAVLLLLKQRNRSLVAPIVLLTGTKIYMLWFLFKEYGNIGVRSLIIDVLTIAALCCYIVSCFLILDESTTRQRYGNRLSLLGMILLVPSLLNIGEMTILSFLGWGTMMYWLAISSKQSKSEKRKKKLANAVDAHKEIRMQCTVCGNIFCYTQADLNNNMLNGISSVVSATGAVAQALGGTMLGAHTLSVESEMASNKVVDYTKCPKCNSKALRQLTEEEYMTAIRKPSDRETIAISAADELKKYKELLDSGVITQEEFDAKKKQLLGL